MGVTLERVQNKFACIIGELCNEPYVLSQFAIWVDLRIAEYKANGAISLDCTGDNPHPTWLKGMNPPKSPIPNRSVNQSGRRHGIYESSGNPTSANESCELSFDSGEFEIIEVKEEPPDFPSCTSFKSHGRLSPTRKRTSESQDFLQSDNSIFPTSPPKSRKLSTASDNNELSGVGQDTVSHQSFMSVIGLADHSAHSVDNLNPSSGEKSQFSNFDQSKGSNPGNIPFEDVAVHPSISTDEVNLRMGPDSVKDGTQYHFLEGRSVQAKRKSTKFNGMSAVRICQRFLAEKCNEFRPIETINASELDSLLARFLSEVKQITGADYHPNSLLSLRKCLDRHLRQQNYPYSIIYCQQFSTFQKAFQIRKTELALKTAQKHFAQSAHLSQP